MYLIIENIQEQFELYFNHEKNIELIKKWAIRYIGYGELQQAFGSPVGKEMDGVQESF